MEYVSNTALTELCTFAEHLADTARGIIVPYFRNELAVEDKPSSAPTANQSHKLTNNQRRLFVISLRLDIPITESWARNMRITTRMPNFVGC